MRLVLGWKKIRDGCGYTINGHDLRNYLAQPGHHRVRRPLVAKNVLDALDVDRECCASHMTKLPVLTYSSLIVSVTAISRIRFAGAYTAAAHDTATNTSMTTIAEIGKTHGSPKCDVTIVSKNHLLR